MSDAAETGAAAGGGSSYRFICVCEMMTISVNIQRPVVCGRVPKVHTTSDTDASAAVAHLKHITNILPSPQNSFVKR